MTDHNQSQEVTARLQAAINREGSNLKEAADADEDANRVARAKKRLDVERGGW